MGYDNSEAFTRLQAAIDSLAELGELPEAVAAAAVAPVRAMILENVAAQRGPGGRAWPPGKDGKPVLTGAGKALTVTSAGPVLTATLTGPEARHHLGAIKGSHGGSLRRQILPGRGTLGGISKIMKRLAAQKWKAATSG